jgi:hypothetical protein
MTYDKVSEHRPKDRMQFTTKQDMPVCLLKSFPFIE